MRLFIPSLIVITALGILGVSAQSGSTTASKPKAAPPTLIKNAVAVHGKHVTLVVGASGETVALGGRVTLMVRVTPGPTIHLYAPGQQGYLPVAVSVAANSALTVRPTVYPPATPYTFMPTAEHVKVYAAPFVLRTDVVVASTPDLKRRAADGDALTMAGTFAYQACDDAVCYRPETLPVAWKVQLAPAAR